MIQYKTRGQADYQGKPYVLFSCHPEDFSVYFQSITDEILHHMDCAIFYYRPEDEHELEALTDVDFERFQLFVIPVTTKLLMDDNMTVRVVLPFAQKHHIPLLPLLQESGLDSYFRWIFGDLQYLDKSKEDSTTLSYDTKLKIFLETVLVGNELAERIRASFDAYIFLSYRKKDRKHARELMELIHKDDMFRDVAIWYDEYLTPGEDFNNSIQSALKKSELFVLAVTPNLLEPENYVMTTEYPMARDEGKAIMSAEMVQTDLNALKDKYENIPNLVDAHNELELSQGLLHNLKSLAKRENDADPIHNYLIGLAYLNGIDVEVNFERAKRLIEGAAESGVQNATAQLVEMYRKGMGVERDLEKALQWQEKLIEQRKKAFQQRGRASDGYSLASAYREFGYLLLDRRYMEKAIQAWKECGALVESLLKVEPKREYFAMLSEAMGLISSAYRSLGKFKEEVAYARKSLDLAEEAVRRNPSEETWEKLLDSCVRVASILIDEKEYKEAELLLQRAEEICRSETLQKDSQPIRWHQSHICEVTAKLCVKRMQYSQARVMFLESLRITEQLCLERCTVTSRRNVAILYQQIADFESKHGDRELALQYFWKALNIFAELAEETDSLENYEDLLLLYETCANLEDDVASEKEKWIRKKQEIEEMLVERQPQYAEYTNACHQSKQRQRKKRILGRVGCIVTILFGMIALGLFTKSAFMLNTEQYSAWILASMAVMVPSVVFGSIWIECGGLSVWKKKTPDVYSTSYFVSRITHWQETAKDKKRYGRWKTLFFIIGTVFAAIVFGYVLQDVSRLGEEHWPWFYNVSLILGGICFFAAYVMHAFWKSTVEMSDPDAEQKPNKRK